MQRSHKIRLEPNNVQITYFKKACGCARLAYNVGLAKWDELYKAGEKPSGYSMKKWFNSIKWETYPFLEEVTKCATDRPFMNLEAGFKLFFKGVGKHPTFKKKGCRDSFYIDSISFKIEGKYLKIPKLGRIKMSEGLRYQGKLMSAVISCTAGQWFVSIQVDIPDEVSGENQTRTFVGIDLGLLKLATTHEGEVFDNPRATKRFEHKLRRASKKLSRRQKGSRNWLKAKLRLSKVHYRTACVRNDAAHKMTTSLSRRFTDVALEDLNTSGMLKNHKLAKHIASAGWHEIRRQFGYKSTVHLCGTFTPSTKPCSRCGKMHNLELSDRWLSCECGLEIDRDHNAAINILRAACPDVMPVEMRAMASDARMASEAKPSSVKQEPNREKA